MSWRFDMPTTAMSLRNLMDKSDIAKKLKTAQFQKKYINIPCLIVSTVLLLASVVAADPGMVLMWSILTAINGLVLVLNSVLIRLLRDTESIFSENDRRKRIHELYGRSE
jgi:hypothetical protein